MNNPKATLLAAMAYIARTVKPGPYLDAIEEKYGKAARYGVICVVILVACLIGAYSFDDVIRWLQ